MKSIVRSQARSCSTLRAKNKSIRLRRTHCQAVATESKCVANYTHFGTNAWSLQFASSGCKFLVDPWLVGTLTFADQTWFMEARKDETNLDQALDGVQFIVLSQSLDDHTHKPTLRKLPKGIPVVAQPDAAKIAVELGFKTVYPLAHGQEIVMGGGAVCIQATPGALVGPPWSPRQNGLLFTEVSTSTTVFYEPHASHDMEALQTLPSVDIAILPTSSAYVLGYAVVEGNENATNLLQVLKPSLLVPLDNNDGEYSGVLASLLSSAGSSAPEQVSRVLKQASIGDIAVAGPSVRGQPLELRVAPKSQKVSK